MKKHLRQTPKPQPVPPAPANSSRVKVFFCERIGDGIATVTHKCERGHEVKQEWRCTEAEWNDRSRIETGACTECAGLAKWSGAGFGHIYRRVDTGEEMGGGHAAKLPPGACYDAHWYHNWRKGSDGRSLMVVLPNGHHWFIDSEASNCTMKGEQTHRCWVRHGKPEDGTLHVDKDGNTCKAGGGSIQSSDYHGFLHNGHLVLQAEPRKT